MIAAAFEIIHFWILDPITKISKPNLKMEGLLQP